MLLLGPPGSGKTLLYLVVFTVVDPDPSRACGEVTRATAVGGARDQD